MNAYKATLINSNKAFEEHKVLVTNSLSAFMLIDIIRVLTRLDISQILSVKYNPLDSERVLRTLGRVD